MYRERDIAKFATDERAGRGVHGGAARADCPDEVQHHALQPVGNGVVIGWC